MPGRPPLADDSPGRRSTRRAALIATAVALPVVVVLALVFKSVAGRPPPALPLSAAAPSSSQPAELPPLDVKTPAVTPEADALCPGLLGGLPLTLGDSPARPVRSASAYAAAWGEPPVVLRCGMPRPAGFAADSSLLQINGVAWFTVPGTDDTVWTAVDRGVYVEVTVPTDQASGPVALISTVISERLPVQPLRFG